MKKLITLIISVTIILTVSNTTDSTTIYAQPPNNQITNREQRFLNELENLNNQIYIFNGQVLDTFTGKKDSSNLLTEARRIHSIINDLRVQLSSYYNTVKNDIDKASIALAFINTLNYYDIALLTIDKALNSPAATQTFEYLEDYFLADLLAEQTINFIKSRFSLN